MNSRWFIYLSVVLNLVLILLLSKKASAPSQLETKTPAKYQTPASTQSEVRNAPTFKSNTVTVIESKLNWSSIEATNYPTYIQNLRDIACPEETIREIISAEINKLYAEKKRALLSASGPVPYWQVDPQLFAYSNPAWDQQVQALEMERKSILKALLGISPNFERDKYSPLPDSQTSKYSFLDPNRSTALKSLDDSYKDDLNTISAKYGGLASAEARAEVEVLQQKKTETIKSLLNEQEYGEYLMRNSQIANKLRTSLASFTPSEQEYRSIYKIEEEYSKSITAASSLSGQQQEEAKQAALQAKENALSNSLGNRYAELQQSRDFHYQQLYTTFRKFNLDQDRFAPAYKIISSLKSDISALNNISTSPENLATRRNQLIEDAQKRLTPILGPQATEVLKSRISVGN